MEIQKNAPTNTDREFVMIGKPNQEVNYEPFA
jgi:hypothetical protein